MKDEAPYRCDVCKRSKQEGNGWFLGVIIHIDSQYLGLPARMSFDPASVYFRDFGVVASAGYALVEWNDAVAASEIPFIHHLCSDKCALTKQAEYLRR